MIYKKEIKYLASLKNKKYRVLNNEFVIEGQKLILDALKYKQNIKKIIYSTKLIDNFNKIRLQAKENNIPLALCTIKPGKGFIVLSNSSCTLSL